MTAPPTDNLIRRVREIRFDSRYSIIKRIGKGGFGKVYLGKDHQSGCEVAIKLEHDSIEPSYLAEEFTLYKRLKRQRGFPRAYWYGRSTEYKVLVFELLGPSLEDVFYFCEKHFTIKTVSMLAEQMLSRLETLHKAGLIYKDVSPRNFMLGTGSKQDTVYLTDLGLVEEHELASDDSYNARVGTLGTPRYTSINGHRGGARCARDDLESLGYLLIYFLQGKLPWQGLKVDSWGEKSALILQKKQQTSVHALCDGLPDGIRRYMEQVAALQEDDQPDYGVLRRIFRTMVKREGLAWDRVYDWEERIHVQYGM